MEFQKEIIEALIPDLRVYDNFYNIWHPISMVEKATVAHNADFQVDLMQIDLPAPHPLDNIWLSNRIIGTPVTLYINGVWWTGRVQTATKRLNQGSEMWNIVVASDDKQLHRLVSLTPSTGANAAQKTIKGSFRTVLRQLIQESVARTGLPMYFRSSATGPDVEIIARVEDTLAGVLSPTVERNPIYVNTTMLLPEMFERDNISAAFTQYMGAAERQWYQQAESQGLYPDLQPRTGITAGPLSVGDELPEYWWWGEANLDVRATGQQKTYGVCWNPFELDAENRTRSGFYEDGSSFHVDNCTRVSTMERLKINQRSWLWMNQFVTHWSALNWRRGNGLALLPAAISAGRVIRLDTGEVLTEAGLQEFTDTIGSGDVVAWLDHATKNWVVATYAKAKEYEQSLAVAGPQKPYPGVCVNLHSGRDRREIIQFGTGPGGGLEAWEAVINAPEAAALVAGAQWGKWTSALMAANQGKQLTVPSSGVASALPGAATAVANSGGSVTSMTADIRPSAGVDNTEVNFSTLTAGMDMGIVGPLFYREKFHSIGSNEWNADVASTFEAEWAAMQGNTAMTLTVGSNACVFGKDVTLADGTQIPGWLEGDRVSFHDGDTRLTEVVTGWEATWDAANPVPKITPLLGKREDRYSPVDELVNLVRDIEKAGTRSQLEPPRLPTKVDIVDVAKEAFTSASVDWNREVRDNLDLARTAVQEAQLAREGAEVSLSEATRLLSGPNDGDFKSVLTLHNETLAAHQRTLAAQTQVDAAQNNAIAAVSNAQRAQQAAQAAAASAQEQLARQVRLIQEEQTRAQVRDDVLSLTFEYNRTQHYRTHYSNSSPSWFPYLTWNRRVFKGNGWATKYGDAIDYVDVALTAVASGLITGGRPELFYFRITRDMDRNGRTFEVQSDDWGKTIDYYLVAVTPKWNYKRLLANKMREAGLTP